MQRFPYDTDCMDYEELWEENGRMGPRLQQVYTEKNVHFIKSM